MQLIHCLSKLSHRNRWSKAKTCSLPRSRYCKKSIRRSNPVHRWATRKPCWAWLESSCPNIIEARNKDRWQINTCNSKYSVTQIWLGTLLTVYVSIRETSRKILLNFPRMKISLKKNTAAQLASQSCSLYKQLIIDNSQSWQILGLAPAWASWDTHRPCLPWWSNATRNPLKNSRSQSNVNYNHSNITLSWTGAGRSLSTLSHFWVVSLHSFSFKNAVLWVPQQRRRPGTNKAYSQATV